MSADRQHEHAMGYRASGSADMACPFESIYRKAYGNEPDAGLPPNVANYWLLIVDPTITGCWCYWTGDVSPAGPMTLRKALNSPP